LNLARELVRQGVSRAVATPHRGRLVRYSSLQEVKEKFRELKGALEEEGIPLEIYPGFEVFLNMETLGEMEALGRELSLAGGRYFLVEFPFHFIYPNWEYLLLKIKEMGFRPIVAHPERYAYILSNPSILERMVSLGALAQVNAESLAGTYGGEVRFFSRECFRRGLCHIMASDAHGVSGRPPLVHRALEELEEVLDGETLEEVLIKRPAAVIGEDGDG